MHERHVRAGPMQFQRRLGRRVAAPNHDDPLSVIGMGLPVIVMHVRQILTGHTQQVRMIVIADRQDDVSGVADAADSARRSRFDGKEHLVLPIARLFGLQSH